ncbi:hypothetical protein SCP_0502610 [Sparassis crispa]|uniref:Uncharacterized protein n=1 Tax=Sparassis crispa TaxID=139825 RepID=A0A401GN95_9APHY|nr:hypothetical protein SCP_0502610 [Sparassis crispa]GBE83214.1 hypothetical protein SCP_0502610 [Sparassis crispa]
MVTNALTHQENVVPSSTDKRSAPGRPVGDVHSRVDSPVDLTEPQAAPLGSGDPQDAQPSASVEVKSKHSQSRIVSTYSPIADPPPGSLRISIKQLSSNAGSQNRMPKDGTSVPISYTDKNKNTECLTQSVSPVALLELLSQTEILRLCLLEPKQRALQISMLTVQTLELLESPSLWLLADPPELPWSVLSRRRYRKRPPLERAAAACLLSNRTLSICMSICTT